MRWLPHLSLLSIIGVALVVGVSVWRSGSTTVLVSSTALPTTTPDNRLDWLMVLITPSPTRTPKPDKEPAPTQTNIPQCSEATQGLCLQHTPRPTLPPDPTLTPYPTLGPCGTPDVYGKLPRLCYKG